MAKYWQKGEKIDYKNAGAAAIEAGDVIVIGEKVGVAGNAIPAGEVGTAVVEGVFAMAKEAEAISAGDSLYFDPAKKTLTKTKATGLTLAGWAVAEAAAVVEEVLVKIN